MQCLEAYLEARLQAQPAAQPGAGPLQGSPRPASACCMRLENERTSSKHAPPFASQDLDGSWLLLENDKEFARPLVRLDGPCNGVAFSA
eukprot:6173156-Pleurochrysis_carterae.AAC.1